MYSRSLIKLIDEALLPAVLIILAEIVGLTLVNTLYNLSWSFTGGGITYATTEELVLANSFSSMVVYAIILVGFSWVVIRAHLTHDTHIHPKVHATLVRLNLTHLIEDTFQIYHEAVVWVSYLWLFSLWFGIQLYLSLIHSIVFVTALILSSLVTWLFITDIEREFHIPGIKQRAQK